MNANRFHKLIFYQRAGAMAAAILEGHMTMGTTRGHHVTS